MVTYAAVFLIAFATLSLEICLTRILSVTTWYHLAFFAISTAMLGMTAGATAVYVRPERFTPERLSRSLARACLGFALSTPVSLIVLCMIPVGFGGTVMSLFGLLIATAACSLPFYFSGIAISAVLTKSDYPIGLLYGFDLLGASAGCLFVLFGLKYMDAPSLILAGASLGAGAALLFGVEAAPPKRRPVAVVVLVVLAASSLVNATTSRGIRPMVVKGRVESSDSYMMEKWNSFSRVAVYPLRQDWPQLWGRSPAMPRQSMLPQHYMNIDGEAGTTIRRFSSRADIEHLRYDVTNAAYHIRAGGPACIIGVGGGRDVQSALYFGHEHVVGVEVNPIFIELINGTFAAFAGLAGRDDVDLVVDEARSYLSATEETFSVIQMSLIDTWAATGAGAFSLSENALYTVEAWKTFLSRLRPDGIFTVSRWYSPENLGETGRVVALAVAALQEMGVTEPLQHLAMVTTRSISTLLVSRSPFTPGDRIGLLNYGSNFGFQMPIFPGRPPAHEVLRKIVAASDRTELVAAIENEPLNYEPPTDDNPYFFNMLRLGGLRDALGSAPGTIRGNLTATLTLVSLIICLAVLVVLTICIPLILKTMEEARRRGSAGFVGSGAWYFSLIGAGFMFLEIGLIQRLSTFLAHPVYALGILLFAMIAATGVGSYISERVPLTERVFAFSLPVVTAATIVIMRFLVPAVATAQMTAPLSTKIAVSIALIAPIGVLLGFFFPMGMRLTKPITPGETPWYWALNGVFGVLSSALAVFGSIYFGISLNFYLAALCYLGLTACISRMRALAKEIESGPETGSSA